MTPRFGLEQLALKHCRKTDQQFHFEIIKFENHIWHTGSQWDKILYLKREFNTKDMNLEIISIEVIHKT